jgi:cell division transport system permease protein
MAIKITYVVKESVNNLRRNLLMTLAALLTVIISLTLAGAALLFRNSVDNATQQFKGGFDLTIFMKTDATPDQISAVRRDLESSPDLTKIRFVTKEEAFEEIKSMFRNRPETLDSFRSAADAPAQFRVKPAKPELIEIIGKRYLKRAGVYSVSYAKAVDLMLKVAAKIQLVILCIAAALLLSAVVLILNTIRMAIYARRREVAVMKLVGATNSFIRLPFMIEGMLQGIFGAAIGFLFVWMGTAWAQAAIRNGGKSLLSQLSVSSGQIASTGIVMLVVGAAAGALGSALAVSRFLDV